MVKLWGMTSTPDSAFDDLWEERKSSPDFDYDNVGDDIPDYDLMTDQDLM